MVSGTAPAAAAPEAAAGLPIDPLRPDRPLDLNDTRSDQDLWGRVRHGFAMPDLSDDWVRRAEQYYSGKPDYDKIAFSKEQLQELQKSVPEGERSK